MANFPGKLNQNQQQINKSFPNQKAHIFSPNMGAETIIVYLHPLCYVLMVG